MNGRKRGREPQWNGRMWLREWEGNRFPWGVILGLVLTGLFGYCVWWGAVVWGVWGALMLGLFALGLDLVLLLLAAAVGWLGGA